MRTEPWLCVFSLSLALQIPGAEPESSHDRERAQGWRGDIDFLQAAVAREHYLFRTNPPPGEFSKLAGELKGAVAEWNDLRVLVELQRLMATLGDGHCYVTPSPKFLQRLNGPPEELPLRLHGFPDGLYVIDANPGLEDWIGWRITRIGFISSEDALRRVADYIAKDNPYGGRWQSPMFLGYPGYLEAIGCIGAGSREIALEFTRADGTEATASVAFAPMSMTPRLPLVPSRVRGTSAVPLHLRQISSNYWFDAVPGREAVYVQFNQVRDSPDESIEAFAARLDGELRRLRPRLLAMDVRYNGGGNADLLPPLIQVLRDFEARELNGKAVVLIGPRTFSAAQIFISILDRDTQAIFAGEPSGSKPNFVGEHNPVELPWSGVIANISNLRHEIIPGDPREWIEPEIKVELSSRDYFANRDPVLETVLLRYAGPDKQGN